jgi:ribosomal protein S17E
MSTFNLNIPKLGRSCRLRSLEIKNTIVGFLSRTNVTMEFENEENIDTEGEVR